jgi:hypothetical protein
MAWFDIVGGLAEGLGQSAQMGLADIAKRRQLEEEKLNEALSRILPGSELTPEMTQQILNSPKLGKAFVGYDSKTKKPYLLPTEAQRRAEVQAFANSDPDATFDEPEARRLQRFGITPQMMTQKDGGLYSRTPTRAEAQSAEDRLTARAEDIVRRVQPGQLIPVTPESKKAAELYPGLFTMGPNNQYQVNQFGPVADRVAAKIREQKQSEAQDLALDKARLEAKTQVKMEDIGNRLRQGGLESVSLVDRIAYGRYQGETTAYLTPDEIRNRDVRAYIANEETTQARITAGTKDTAAYKEQAGKFFIAAFERAMDKLTPNATQEDRVAFMADAINQAASLTESVYPGAMPRATVTPSGQNNMFVPLDYSQSSSNSQNSLGQKSSSNNQKPVAKGRIYPPPGVR